ncbi:hypothetical protein NDK50_14910 [Paraburkholderia bryophila]|uniref:hypothetical protein n=1 Tax=Paraburkholderia bryophila TaxID=420952 RepID=UPI0023495FE4|nr:hypothetical protein [Paraburkholderia bryophila]WCM18329.1 hypothetical protein NDK50_12740 [Paraburkholderia bryophila]WCM18723.1 hypothetical protein NDK50_14910 [Paraburkholderia bryophila]
MPWAVQAPVAITQVYIDFAATQYAYATPKKIVNCHNFEKHIGDGFYMCDHEKMLSNQNGDCVTGSMIGNSLIWAAVPHTGDGVVFQLRLHSGTQRFYVPRDLLEAVFGLERGASDAGQLALFYRNSNRIFSEARVKRAHGSSDTVQLLTRDFNLRDADQRRSGSGNASSRMT